jgi:tetratricopeptide (TPR) repeat protein
LKTSRIKPSLLICLVLAVVTFGVYWPMTHHDFILFDDPQYITDNAHVTAGVTWRGIVWAFTNDEAANWHPLTWISHMVDCDLFGLYAGGHHLVNLLFHIANSVLLFLWLSRLTGALWRSAFVAAFFAWHPLHVESVAWAAERKDVLSTFFWLLTLMAYTSYVQRRAKLETKGAPLKYGLALLLFACGLMSKPMVVTLPFVLLLLDFWPLQRFSLSTFNLPLLLRLVVEKIPFFALAVAGSVATYLAQKTGGALWTLTALPPQDRIANALLSYVRYISKTVWPTDMAIIYTHPRHWPVIVTIGCVLVLAAWTGLFLWRLRRNPYLVVGWLWFLGTLIPTIGLVQVGSQSMADRYMYIPSIGLFIVVVWGLNDLLDRWPERKKFLPLAGGAALAGCLAVTSLQLSHWQNSFSLFLHAIDATGDNYVAYNCLGQAFKDAGRKPEATELFLTSVAIESNFPPSQINLAQALDAAGRPGEAEPHYQIAVRLLPQNPDLRYDAGTFFLHQDNMDEAIRQFLAALEVRPAFPQAHNALGWAYLRQAKLDQAVPQFMEALRLKPDFADAHLDLAVALTQQGKTNEAFPHFIAAVKFQPRNAEMRFNLGLALLDRQKPAEAAVQFTEEVRLTPNETKAHYRLAQALQRQGKFAEAVPHYREALRFTPDFPDAKAELAAILAAHPELKVSEPLDTAH